MTRLSFVQQCNMAILYSRELLANYKTALAMADMRITHVSCDIRA